MNKKYFYEINCISSDDEDEDDEDDISLTSTHTITNDTLNDLDNPTKSRGTIKPGCSYKKTKLLKSLHISNASESDTTSRTGSEYSPPSLNSMSLPPTPSDTPVPQRKVTKYGIASETKSMNGRSSKKIKICDVSPVREEGGSGDGCVQVKARKPKTLSASNVALTNVRVRKC